MRKNINTAIFIIAIIGAIISSISITNWVLSGKLSEKDDVIRKEKIKSSRLEKINDGLYTKLAADTLEIKELKKLNDSLELELENPIIITEVKYVPKEQDTEVDVIEETDSTFTFTDFYPNKSNPFITYSSKINTQSKTGVGNFSFNPIKMDLGIEENNDGTFSINTKLPDFFEVTSLEVKSLPLATPKPDNFGWIVGARLGKDFTDLSGYLKLNGGIRYKKLYLSVGAGTNGTVEGGLDYEF